MELINKKSNILDEINKIRHEWCESDIKFRKRIEEIKDKCNHKYDNGIDATFEVRYSYNNYGKLCEICDRRIE
jgi:hypothetical protein